MKLRYKATNEKGKVAQGLLDAKDINEAATYLRSKGLMPVQITKVETDILENLPFLNKVKTSDVILFTRQLSSMLSSGLTLMRCLEILKTQIANGAMSEIIASIIADVEEGNSFADALSKYPEAFSHIYVSIVRAGEKSGLLDKVLSRLADNLEKQAKLKSTIKSALLYPAIIVALMIGVTMVLLIVVVPQLTNLYKTMNIDLPIYTQIIVFASNILVVAWPVVLGLFAVLFVAFRRFAKTDDGKLILDSLILKMPIFGELIGKSVITEFSRTFGLLIGTGSLVVDSLNQSAEVASNVLYKNAIFDVSKRVEKGEPIGTALSYNSLFPPLLVQLAKVGEQTGKIDENLLRASEYFEREVDTMVKNLTTLMEPFIMVALGIGVAFLIFSIITPIYKITTAF